MEGWIKLHRQIIDSAVFDDAEVLKVWVWILCSVYIEDTEIIMNGVVIHAKAGQKVTGRKKMSTEIGISESKIQRALNILKKLDNITIESTNKYSILTAKKWQKFQLRSGLLDFDEQQNNSKTTSKQQQNDIKPTAKQQQNDTYKEYKNKRIKELKNIRVCKGAHAQAETVFYGVHENVELTAEEYDSIPNRDEAIAFFSEYLNALKNPYPKKHHYALTTWVQKALRERKGEKAEPITDSFDVDEFVKAATKKSGY
jgi:hypothetical protein